MRTTPSIVTAANVRAEMARKNITQTSLAGAVGVSQSGMSKRLKGSIPFDINEIGAIADHLGIPISALIPADVSEALSA